MDIEDINTTNVSDDQDTPPELFQQYNFPRRAFLISGAISAAALVLGTRELHAVEIPPSEPEPVTDPGNPIGDEIDPNLTVLELISSYNEYARMYNIQLYPGFAFGSEFTNPDELIGSVNYWGGLDNDLPMPGYIKIGLLCVPISKLYCGSGIPQLPAFTLRLGLNVSNYEYKPTDYGYMVVEGEAESASMASLTETEDNDGNNPIDKTRYIISDDAIVSPAVTDSEETPKGARYSSFAEAVSSNFSENGLNQFSRELYPSIRSAYDSKIVRIATADGRFSGIDDVPGYGGYLTVYNVNFGGHPFHAILLHAALHGIFGTDYDSVQMRIDDVGKYVEDRGLALENGEDIKPSVVCLPFSIGSLGVPEKISEMFSGRNPDKLKTIVVASTPNADIELQLGWEIPSSVIYCSTVRKDNDGNLYIPAKRASVKNGETQDKFFLFPDQTDSLGVELGAEMVNGQFCLFPEYYSVSASGASLSTLVASTFISAIISKLLASGEEYSEELIMQTLKDLCPLVKVGDVTGRVPDVDKVKAFFGVYEAKLNIPSLYNGY